MIDSESMNFLQETLDMINDISNEPIPDGSKNIFNMGDWKNDQDCVMNKMVYRVMRLEHLIKWCDEGMNVLPDVNKWDDPWERGIFRSPISHPSGELISTNNFKYYGQCWSFNSVETDATWRIFKANEGGCVRIGVRARDLYDCLVKHVGAAASISCYAGQVIYKNEDEVKDYFESELFSELLDSQAIGLTKTLFVKRTAFAHEKEFRVLYFPTQSGAGEYGLSMPQPDGSLFKYKMSPNLIKFVQLGPKVSCSISDCLNVRKEDATTIDLLKSKGITCKINRSTIYDCPLISVKY